MTTVPVEISNHHVHLSTADVGRLFGPGGELHQRRPISQSGQYAAEEVVKLVGPEGSISHVRVVGPVRSATQVEISASDGKLIGLDPPQRDSGDLDGSAGATLVGPAGQVILKAGVIRQRRHLHATTEDCQRYGLQPGGVTNVTVNGHTFNNVFIKVHPSFVWRLHLDTDEAQQAGIRGGEIAEVVT